MDGNRFDDLTRGFYSRRSRRAMLKAAAASVAGLAAGVTKRGRHLSLGGSYVDAQTATPTPCSLTCPANITLMTRAAKMFMRQLRWQPLPASGPQGGRVSVHD
jgi:hypothetical protein